MAAGIRSVQVSRLTGSISFRLTALHIALSVLSIVIVGTIVTLTVGTFLNDQMQDRIRDASRALQDEYLVGGLPGTEQAIRRQTQLVGSLEYRLEDGGGRLLLGDLPPVPRDRAWSTTRLPQSPASPGQDAYVLSLAVVLPGSELLVVGEALGSVSDARSAVGSAFALAMGAVIVIGVAGGFLLNAAVVRRVSRMADTARAVMAGDLTRRIDGAAARDELGWLATVFNHMLDRIADLVELNRQIGAALAHDLRSPLTHLSNRLEAARRRATRIEDYESAVDAATADVNGILATFNAILRIAQVEAGTRRASFRRVDVSAVLSNVAEAYEVVAQDRGQAVSIAIEPGAALEGDGELLTQLFANLIENAIRHAGNGARLGIGCETLPNAVRAVVSDDGPGIPAEHRTKVLERFVRLDPSRSEQGSGLGLTLCAAIVDLHGGTLRLDSNEPGLRCVVELPSSSNH